jgi:hypothetical protein
MYSSGEAAFNRLQKFVESPRPVLAQLVLSKRGSHLHGDGATIT